jgi:RNA polymerase sigma-70 factor (ECF subfamily)
MRAWQSLRRGTSPSDPETWLMTIAHRACMDRLRNDYRQRRRLHRLIQQPLSLSAPSADHDVAGEADLLDVLEPDRRAAFVLSRLLGYSYADTAAICGTNIGTIRSRIARARTELVRAHRAQNLRMSRTHGIDSQ